MGDRVLGIVLMMARRKLLGLFCCKARKRRVCSSAKMDLGWQEDVYGVIETFHSVIAIHGLDIAALVE